VRIVKKFSKLTLLNFSFPVMINYEVYFSKFCEKLGHLLLAKEIFSVEAGINYRITKITRGRNKEQGRGIY